MQAGTNNLVPTEAEPKEAVVVEEPPAEVEEPETQTDAPLYPPPPQALIQAMVHQLDMALNVFQNHSPEKVRRAAEEFVTAMKEWAEGKV